MVHNIFKDNHLVNSLVQDPKNSVYFIILAMALLVIQQSPTTDMTPAINQAKKAKIKFSIHEYNHSTSCSNYGMEAAKELEISEERIFKTLVVQLNNKQLAVGILPVSRMLSMKQIAKAASAKKAVMADKNMVGKSTGYVLGGVSPLGQKRQLPTFIDSSAKDFPTIYVSAGKRGLEIELTSDDLLKITRGTYQQICL